LSAIFLAAGATSSSLNTGMPGGTLMPYWLMICAPWSREKQAGGRRRSAAAAAGAAGAEHPLAVAGCRALKAAPSASHVLPAELKHAGKAPRAGFTHNCPEGQSPAAGVHLVFMDVQKPLLLQLGRP
jgi:hypothetical protein